MALKMHLKSSIHSPVTTLLCLLLFVAHVSCQAHYRVTLYTREELQGRYITMEGNSCQDLPDLRYRISSVYTHGTCVELYDKDNCKGQSVQVNPSEFNQDLSQYKFRDATASVGPCGKVTNQEPDNRWSMILRR